MTEMTSTGIAFEESRNPPWPRGAVTPVLPDDGRGFVVSVHDFSRQARSWTFFRRLSIGYVSGVYVFGQGAVSLAELLL